MILKSYPQTKVIGLVVCLVVLIGLAMAMQSWHQNLAGREVRPRDHVQSSLVVPFEVIMGHLKARNGFAWTYSYDIGLKQKTLVVRVAINIIPAKGVTRVQLDRVKPSWEKAIERVWSKKYAIKTATGKRYPIMIDATFKGPHFNHEVIVRPGNGNTDELNWRLLDTPELIAHEFGHMLGEYDEYGTGGLNPDNPIIDSSSVMQKNPNTKTKAHKRHYEQFRQWFMKNTGLKDVSLVALESVLPTGTGTDR